MNRRNFLKLFGAGAAAAVVPGCTLLQPIAAVAEKPKTGKAGPVEYGRTESFRFIKTDPLEKGDIFTISGVNNSETGLAQQFKVTESHKGRAKFERLTPESEIDKLFAGKPIYNKRTGRITAFDSGYEFAPSGQMPPTGQPDEIMEANITDSGNQSIPVREIYKEAFRLLDMPIPKNFKIS